MVRGKNIEYPGEELQTQKISVLGGFSEVKGNEHCLVTEGSVNQETLITWLTKLKSDPGDYFLVMDNW